MAAMPRSALSLVGLLSLVLWAPLQGQGRVNVKIDAKLLKCVTAYRAAAEEYRAGRVDTAAQALARLDRSDLRTMIAVLMTAREVAAQAADPSMLAPFTWDRPLLLAAGMLHVDVAIADYKQRRYDDFRYHTAVAATAFEAADLPRPGTDETAGNATRRSTLAIALMLLGDADAYLGEEYLKRAVVRFPDDVRIILTYGTLKETEATTRMSPAPRFDDASILSSARAVRDESLHDAAILFERALAIDPALVEARVRLAHARTLEHDDARAMLLLNQALAAQPEAAWVYLARLILGGIQERAGRPESAMQFYRAALAVKPEGQSAYIALSQAMHRRGDGRAAADVLVLLFNRHLTPTSDDPWWDYPFGKWRDAEPMLEGLRREARQ
jgi:tetratricopeptide (TPR) repeat protein